MPGFQELQDLFDSQPSNRQGKWLYAQIDQHLGRISQLLNSANVVCYFSAFLSKPQLTNTSISDNDIHGFMNAFAGMNCKKGLALILHTPGGGVRAAEMLIEYLHSKFTDVTAIVPVMSDSAGTLMALSCYEIIISRAGQLGPVDSQLGLDGWSYSVKDLIKQFNTARQAIVRNQANAFVWTPILEAYAPALHQQALNERAHSKQVLNKWLAQKGKSEQDRRTLVKFFHDDPKVHGERIDHNALKDLPLKHRLLESNQNLQDHVLSLYHLMNILVANTNTAKLVVTNTGRFWHEPGYSQHAP